MNLTRSFGCGSITPLAGLQSAIKKLHNRGASWQAIPALLGFLAESKRRASEIHAAMHLITGGQVNWTAMAN